MKNMQESVMGFSLRVYSFPKQHWLGFQGGITISIHFYFYILQQTCYYHWTERGLLRNETPGIASRTPEESSATSPTKGVCSVSALEAVVGMGRDPLLAPREPQPLPAPTVAPGVGRVPVWKSEPVPCFPCPQGEAVGHHLDPSLLAPSGLCREK